MFCTVSGGGRTVQRPHQARERLSVPGSVSSAGHSRFHHHHCTSYANINSYQPLIIPALLARSPTEDGGCDQSGAVNTAPVVNSETVRQRVCCCSSRPLSFNIFLHLSHPSDHPPVSESDLTILSWLFSLRYLKF